MVAFDIATVQELADQNRAALSSEFFKYYNEIGSHIANGKSPTSVRPRGLASIWNSTIGPAIFEELRILICTSDVKYKDVRRSGGTTSKSAVLAIAGYISGSYGIEIGAATGAVAFLAMLVIKISTQTFCKLVSNTRQRRRDVKKKRKRQS